LGSALRILVFDNIKYTHCLFYLFILTLFALPNYYTLRKLCLYDFINQRSLVK